MKNHKNREDQAFKRAMIIVKVRNGEITATEGARQLGVSRKTYYAWEKRGLAGMLTALEDQETGRPSQPEDPEKEKLRKLNRELEQQLQIANQRVEIKRSQLEYEKRQLALERERKEQTKKKNKPE